MYIFFSRTTEPISTKLYTKHPWVNGIQVCSNEGPHQFQGEIITKKKKKHWGDLKIFFSRNTWPVSIKLQSIHGWREFKFVQIQGHVRFQGKIIRKKWKYIEEIKNLIQTWHIKASMGEATEGDSSLLKWRVPPFSKGN